MKDDVFFTARDANLVLDYWEACVARLLFVYRVSCDDRTPAVQASEEDNQVTRTLEREHCK